MRTCRDFEEMIILDTNVVSELITGRARPDSAGVGQSVSDARSS